MDENIKREVYVLTFLCKKYLENDNNTITLNKEDVVVINTCLKQIANYEKKIIDKKYPKSEMFLQDFKFEKFNENNMNGYFMSDDKKCIVRLRDDFSAGQHYIKKNFAYLLSQKLQTIFHEYNHYKQYLDHTSSKALSYDNYVMTAETIIRQELKIPYYDLNYINILKELDSRQVGRDRTLHLLGCLNGVDKSKKMLIENFKTGLINSKEYIDNISRIAPKTVDGDKYQDQEAFISRQLDMIISKKPNYIKKYPVLKYFYNENGVKKSPAEIIKTLSKSPETEAELFSEAMYSAIEEANVQQIEEIGREHPDIFDFLKNVIRLKHKDEMAKIQILEKKLKDSEKKDDRFILEQLSEILDAKYRRSDKMLELYKEKKYQEGYNFINYSTINGSDIPFEDQIDTREVLIMIKMVNITIEIINAYLKTESCSEFCDRACSEEVSVKFLLETLQQKKLSDSFLRLYRDNSEKYSMDHLRRLATLLIVAKDLSIRR